MLDSTEAVVFVEIDARESTRIRVASAGEGDEQWGHVAIGRVRLNFESAQKMREMIVELYVEISRLNG